LEFAMAHAAARQWRRKGNCDNGRTSVLDSNTRPKICTMGTLPISACTQLVDNNHGKQRSYQALLPSIASGLGGFCELASLSSREDSSDAASKHSQGYVTASLRAIAITHTPARNLFSHLRRLKLALLQGLLGVGQQGGHVVGGQVESIVGLSYLLAPPPPHCACADALSRCETQQRHAPLCAKPAYNLRPTCYCWQRAKWPDERACAVLMRLKHNAFSPFRGENAHSMGWG
jgi:hypothetical protein